MSFASLFILALGLAMDATAVAATRGLAAKTLRVRDALLVAALFGGFQAAMPAIGYVLGAAFASRIAGWGHWVTFLVLGGIGAKMLHEARSSDEAESAEEAAAKSAGSTHVFGFSVLVLLAIATSIDALVAGVTLALANVPLGIAVLVIGTVTAALSFAGVFVGRTFGARLGKRLELVGGLVLVGLALKTLAEHFAS